MKTIVITPPVTEPVTLDEAKAQLRIESAFTLDDDYINSLISVARDRCENYCNQFFTEQSIAIVVEGKAEGFVDLPYPGITIDSITYTDPDNAEQSIDAADYVYNAETQKLNFVESFDSIDFTVNATTSAPAQIVGVQQAIKMMVTDMYELRTETVVGPSIADNPALDAMLYPYRKSLGI